MPTYEFKRTGAMRTVAVDGKELTFANNLASKNLGMGEYSVQWFARGDPGNKFSLTAGRKNATPQKETKGTIDSSRKDSGMFWLVVE